MNLEALTKTQLSCMTNTTRAQVGLPTVTRRDVSIMSRPKDRNAKRARHAANAELRAQLHAQKQAARGSGERVALQTRIDAIGAGGQSNE